MTASDYPVNNPYDPPNHNGKDRAMPTATEIFKGSKALLSGNTGKSSGSHLHTQAGTDKATQKVFDPTRLEFKPGVVVAYRKTDPYISGEAGGEWGKYATLQVGDEYITYAHLSVVNVTLGQVIRGESLVLEEQRPVFRAEYYLKANPDVAKNSVWGKNPKGHWLKYGIKEGRKSAPNFHVKEYLANYGDLRRAYGNTGYAKAVKHYYNYGINEGRSGTKLKITQPDKYKQLYEDLKVSIKALVN